MFASHPGLPADFTVVVERLSLCEQACVLCANACFSEKSNELGACIQEALACAEVSRTTASLLLRQTAGTAIVPRAQLQACIAACQAYLRAAADQGREHPACAVCSEICRECEEACYLAITLLPPDYLR